MVNTAIGISVQVRENRKLYRVWKIGLFESCRVVSSSSVLSCIVLWSPLLWWWGVGFLGSVFRCVISGRDYVFSWISLLMLSLSLLSCFKISSKTLKVASSTKFIAVIRCIKLNCTLYYCDICFHMCLGVYLGRGSSLRNCEHSVFCIFLDCRN